MLVVADYLVLIGVIDLLPELFGRIVLPDLVRDEMQHAHTPEPVRRWMIDMPSWVEVADTPPLDTLPLPALAAGERAAIALALSRSADLVLMDDREGVAAADAAGLPVIGTLGVLDRAASRGLVDLPAAIERLRRTNFRYRPEMLDALLAQHKAKKP